MDKKGSEGKGDRRGKEESGTRMKKRVEKRGTGSGGEGRRGTREEKGSNGGRTVEIRRVLHEVTESMLRTLHSYAITFAL